MGLNKAQALEIFEFKAETAETLRIKSVEKIFRRLARKIHPDKNNISDATEFTVKMQQLLDARETLLNLCVDKVQVCTGSERDDSRAQYNNANCRAHPSNNRPSKDSATGRKFYNMFNNVWDSDDDSDDGFDWDASYTKNEKKSKKCDSDSD
jgi:DnaJ-class molecular chaperone